MLLGGNPVRSGDENCHFVGNGRRRGRANFKVNALRSVFIHKGQDEAGGWATNGIALPSCRE